MDSDKRTPNGTPNLATSAINSPLMGQPMGSSYENQWLGTEGYKLIPTRKKSIRKSEDSKNQDVTSIKNKPTTKAERRALQEKQRLLKKQKQLSGASTTPNPPESPAVTPSTLSAGKSLQKSGQNGLEINISNNDKQQQKQQLKQHHSSPQKSILNHLALPKKPNTEKNKDLHPDVLKLGLYFSHYKIVGANARCIAVLETFSKVIKEHRPPPDASFVRHIQKHLDPHIAFLLDIRNMSLSVRECIRWLKKSVADLVADNPTDDEARQILQDKIAHFIRERITMADKLIVQYALTKIVDGDIILTYAKSSVVEKILLEAKSKNVNFEVIVIDGRPLLEGKNLVERLSSSGIRCKYALISSIYIALKSVTKVLLGAHAILNNGSSYSRIGSAAIAMAAVDNQIPVMICCETYKFVNRTQVDSLVMNEKADPNELVYTKQIFSNNTLSNDYCNQSELANWKHLHNLNIVNLMYDVTPSKYITLVVTEIGIIPSTSAPVIWREFNEGSGALE